MSNQKYLLHVRWDAKELLAAQPPGQAEPTNAGILAYEMGDFIKSLMFYGWGRGDRGYWGEAHTALADVLTQLRLAACRMELDFWQAMRDGEDRYMERMEQVKAAGVKEAK